MKNPEISKLSKIEAMNLRKVKLMRKFTTRLTIYTLLLTIILTACQAVPTLAPPTEPPAQATPTRAATATVEQPPEPTPSATNQPPVYVYQGNADLPEGLEQLVAQQNLPQPQGSPNEIAYSFDFNNANPVGNWVYALVAPFPTVSEEVSFDWLRNLWQGQPEDVIDRKSVV